MTTTRKERQALRIYEDDPIADGDAVLMLDESVVLELAGLADQWRPDDAPALLQALGQSERVLLAIARRGGDLRVTDHALAGQLRAALADRGVDLPPVQALPAA